MEVSANAHLHVYKAQKTDANKATRRIKLGECPECGLSTHSIGLLGSRRPKTNLHVLSGRCLLCFPLNTTVNGTVQASVGTPAQLVSSSPSSNPPTTSTTPLATTKQTAGRWGNRFRKPQKFSNARLLKLVRSNPFTEKVQLMVSTALNSFERVSVEPLKEAMLNDMSRDSALVLLQLYNDDNVLFHVFMETTHRCGNIRRVPSHVLEKLQSLLQSRPRIAKLRLDDTLSRAQGFSLLHCCMRDNAPVEIVQLVVSANPIAASYRANGKFEQSICGRFLWSYYGGVLPLHLAAKHSDNFATMEIVLKAYPEGRSCKAWYSPSYAKHKVNHLHISLGCVFRRL